jgi:hypothetical protein
MIHDLILNKTTQIIILYSVYISILLVFNVIGQSMRTYSNYREYRVFDNTKINLTIILSSFFYVIFPS